MKLINSSALYLNRTWRQNFSCWYLLANGSRVAADTNEDNIRRVLAITLLNFIHSLAQEDEAIRQLDRSDVEAAGFTDFATEVAQSEQDDGKPGGALVFGGGRLLEIGRNVFSEACLRRV
ncbi:hypothetical protein PAXRUDRAFT_492776 [Paxillus rubicundulus Ve08.2h10]|uniref:Uncharacterized protein n=1 Tax=Paxillus rubicundulus Ve08.2h10 TaxID=930991 RepID=A0A0D0E131_9AGAM|nr:hypothetical protein PAXRUDRAFT_492776 [Paxillus rubicundulus Ve08.2h10]